MQIDQVKQKRKETVKERYPDGQPGLFQKNNYFGKPDRPDNQKRRETLEIRYPDGLNPVTAFSKGNNPMNNIACRDKMVETRRSHPLGYHRGRTPFGMSLETNRVKARDKMTHSNPMKDEEVKQRKRDKMAKGYGFTDDKQMTDYINDLYGVMAMGPSMISKVIGCDRSTIKSRLSWVPPLPD